MDKINPLNPLLGKIEKFEQADSQGRQWESSRVEWTLRRLKLESQRKELAVGYFTFVEFNRVVNFPMRLAAEPMLGQRPVHRDPLLIHPMWFKSFQGLSFVRSYEEKFEDLGNPLGQLPFGMVFPRKGFLQGMLLHNGDWDLFVPPKSSCHIFKGGKKHSMNLVVQPYAGFIDHVCTGLSWTP